MYPFLCKVVKSGSPVLVDANISHGHTRLSVTPDVYAIQCYNLSYHSVLWSNLSRVYRGVHVCGGQAKVLRCEGDASGIWQLSRKEKMAGKWTNLASGLIGSLFYGWEALALDTKSTMPEHTASLVHHAGATLTLLAAKNQPHEMDKTRSSRGSSLG